MGLARHLAIGALGTLLGVVFFLAIAAGALFA